MGQETINELLELADSHEHGHGLSTTAMIRLILVLVKENYKETRALNGHLTETIERVGELERYPSLTALCAHHPKQMIIAFILLFVVLHIVIDFHVFEEVLKYVGMIF